MGEIRERGPKTDSEALFRDTGCELHPSCLTCPLPVCYEEASANQREELRMVMALTNNKCPRCRGTVQRTNGLDGPVLACLACAREYPIPGDPPSTPPTDQLRAEPPSVPVKLVHVATQDWLTAAQADLKAKLKEIESVSHLQQEAARIHAALTAYGVPSLPALPWSGEKRAKQNRGGSLSTIKDKRCQRCGSGFSSYIQTRKEGDGLVCRREGECAERQKAQSET